MAGSFSESDSETRALRHGTGARFRLGAAGSCRSTLTVPELRHLPGPERKVWKLDATPITSGLLRPTTEIIRRLVLPTREPKSGRDPTFDWAWVLSKEVRL